MPRRKGDRFTLITSTRYIPVKNTVGWNAVVSCEGGAKFSALVYLRLLKPERLTHLLSVESDRRNAVAYVFDRICTYFLQASPEIMKPILAVKATAVLLRA